MEKHTLTKHTNDIISINNQGQWSAKITALNRCVGRFAPVEVSTFIEVNRQIYDPYPERLWLDCFFFAVKTLWETDVKSRSLVCINWPARARCSITHTERLCGRINWTSTTQN